MTRVFQLVAVVLMVAVLGGTQCAELCSFLSFEREAKTSQATEPPMSCHQTHESEGSQPSHDEQCTHHEMLAEKRTVASSMDDLHPALLVDEGIDAQFVPLLAASATTVDQEFPRLSPLTLTSILRI